MPESNKLPDDMKNSPQTGVLASGEYYRTREVKMEGGATLKVVETIGAIAIKKPLPKALEVIREPEHPPYMCPNGDECPSDSSLVQPVGWENEEGGEKKFYCPDCEVPFSADLSEEEASYFMDIFDGNTEDMLIEKRASVRKRRKEDFEMLIELINGDKILPEDF